MATIARTRSLRTSSVSDASFHPLRTRPIVGAVRHYWSSRHPSGKHGACSPYSYMRPYPQRRVPRYDEHVNGLEYRYMQGVYGCRIQSRRNSSNWAPDEDPREPQSRSRDKRRSESERQKQDEKQEYQDSASGKDFWETRTRHAGERYLRLMEEHMQVLRKDPYWGLFGASEERGVWNPWKRYHRMHERMVKEMWPQEVAVSKAEQPKKDNVANVTKAMASEEQDVEYRVDPITNRKVRCEPHQRSDSSQTDSSVSIPVKTYSATSPRPDPKDVPNSNVLVEKTASGIVVKRLAKKPWLVQEGFVPPSQKIGHLVNKEASKLIPDRTLNRQVSSSQAVDADSSLKEEDSSRSMVSIPSISPPQRLVTALSRSSQDKRELKYDDNPDKREDLDLLRASDVRAASGKVIRREAESPLSQEQRWKEIESVMSRIMKDREERLNAEFAADRWELRRAWQSYPGEIPRTMEERRARRRLLERSFNSSLNKFEHDMMLALGTTIFPAGTTHPKTASGDGSDLGIHSTSSMRNVARYIQGLREAINAKHTEAARAKQEAIRRQTDALLQKEISQQKAAMFAREERPRFFRSRSNHLERTMTLSAVENAIQQAKDGRLRSKAKTMIQKKSSGDDLANKLRSIYEDAYGLIDVNHRQGKLLDQPEMSALKPQLPGQATQSSATSEQVKASQTSAEITNTKEVMQAAGPKSWILLAYDKATEKVKVVRTTSSRYEEKSARRTINSILDKLDHPSAYFDYIERLEKSGFELVAGSKAMLVYKDKFDRSSSAWIDLSVLLHQPELGDASEVSPSVAKKATKHEVATVSSSEGNESGSVASSTKASPSTALNRSPPVRRLEERFSGPGVRFSEPPPYEQEQMEEQQRGGHVKRMFWRTLVVVGVVYVFGVFMEWSKERDREQLTKEYQQEVKRVRELERKRAYEEKNNLAARWGF